MAADLLTNRKKGTQKGKRMITLSAISDYLIMLAIAAGAGGVGGLVFELMQTRFEGGTFEVPGTQEGGKYFDIGGIC